jgi:hypothetical protein
MRAFCGENSEQADTELPMSEHCEDGTEEYSPALVVTSDLTR